MAHLNFVPDVTVIDLRPSLIAEKAAALYLADRPYIYLWHPTLIYGLSPNLEGFKVVPECSYVAAAFGKHPEWADLRG